MTKLAVFLLVTLPFSASAEETNSPPPPPFATVMAIEGLAALEPAHSNLAVGQVLKEGSRITTMENSAVRIKFADGAAIQVGPHSELEIKRNRQEILSLHLIHGMVLSAIKAVVGKPSAKDKFELKAHKVAMGVRGTEFFVRQDLNQPAFLCVCNGRVHAKWAEGKLELQSLKPHEHFVNIRHTKKKAVKALDMGHDHTDQQIEELKKLL